MRAAGGEGSMTPEVEAAMMELADDWLSATLAFGCGAARRQRSQMLEPSDLAPYLQRVWYGYATLGRACSPTTVRVLAGGSYANAT